MPALLHNPVTNSLKVFAAGTDVSVLSGDLEPGHRLGAWTMTDGWAFRSSPYTVYNTATRTAEAFNQGTDGTTAGCRGLTARPVWKTCGRARARAVDWHRTRH
ncbi:hypothetical protein ACFVHI_10520 [Kitasatospora sp. NPDC127121]|uniref:hypothetical protein n=1 Tax=Kitasatospora sp. NPDC127121 TaxID=3345371 RepID=UPI00363F99F3